MIVNGNWQAIGGGLNSTVRLGKNLYVHLAGAKPLGGGRFPAKKILSYDIIDVSDPEATPVSILKQEYGNTLGYGVFDLPTFVLQSKDEDLRVMLGSCRKLHGLGEDAMQQLHEQLLVTANIWNQRPHALFLSGDQIYADDVCDSVLRQVSILGKELTESSEVIPDLPELQNINLRQRGALLEKHAHFTSGHGDNHLISFGEFAGMYLLAWHPRAWKGIRFTESDDLDRIQVPRLKQSAKVISNVRRLLANVPTYMLFDDHEVTDDWYINRSWKDKVLGTRTGRRIIANGLAAYWAFQAWGNEPRRFNKSFIESIQAHLNENWNTSRDVKDGKVARNFESALIDFNNWSFIAPTYPLSLFLDTRTAREGRIKPRLMSSKAWKFCYSLLASEWKSRGTGGHIAGPWEPIVIVAPGPVWGFEIVESLQEGVVNIGGKMVHELEKLKPLLNKANYPPNVDEGSAVPIADAESWRINGQSLIDFFRFMEMVQPKVCIVISGDVHYGFLSAGRLRGKADLKLNVPFIQVTSSALKNEPVDKASESYVTSKLAIHLMESIELVFSQSGIKYFYLDNCWDETTREIRKSIFGRCDFNERVLFQYDGFSKITKINNAGMLNLASDGSVHQVTMFTNDSKKTSFEFKLAKWPVA